MISIIIPTLNEAKNLPLCLEALAKQNRFDVEVIVVDGGSQDKTMTLARDAGCRVVTSEPGRGQQLYHGANLAKGDTLLFLHADTILPEGALKAMADLLESDPKIGGGNFRVFYDGGDAFSTWLTGFCKFIRKLGFYYGDSAIYVRKSVYDAIKGIKPIPLMEDFNLVWKMERFGKTGYIKTPEIVTSARRFEGRAKSEIVWGWIKIHVLYFLNIDPARLAQMYRSGWKNPRVPENPSG